MAFINLSSLFSLLLILSLFTLTSQFHRRKPTTTPPPFFPSLNISLASATAPNGGQWTLLQKSIGVSAMHMQLLHNNKVVIFDRTDFGPSNLTLPDGKCRYNDEVLHQDCTAHSLLYDVASNTFRPLMVQTDVWCSSGAVNSDGTLVQTGGYHDGDHKIRLFTPCLDELCDWIELQQNLTVQRWYSSDHILPDGRIIVVGGRRAFSYEFFPTVLNQKSIFYFPFLKETTDPKEENNLYPFLHLLPDGNLFVFANQRSVVLDYVNNKIVKEFPTIPGEKRTYPATGSSVLLPLRLNPAAAPEAEVMICGGARGGAYMKAAKGIFVPASKTCGRLRVTDLDPKWVMEEMPSGRVMPDMLLLPTGAVIILNGAEKARMYHSAATLLPDGRILVGGSNPHRWYNFTDVRYPTELSLEDFSPPYMDAVYSHLRPSILSVEGPTDNFISYGQAFSITFSLGLYQPVGEYIVTMVAPSFTTHSFAMNQRLMVLYIVSAEQLSTFAYKVTVYAPATANVAPPGYYMVFVVHQGVPSYCAWIRMK
ncbi:hypothetical protein RD792_015291 [Penstemon davidsonii]|uniref:Galactose oxidase n=1 Tax=Penstemon davidsonii TaxID=160366 RepID=A0ABR0CT89_9LAMI|nr:hypothetical protein RD792_015291 [Penstemon davidsonii]